MVHVNRKLLPIKAHYFLFNAGTAPVMPFIPTIAKQLGIPSSGVGIMYTIFPFVGLIAKPTFGALADKFHQGKVIFLTAIALTAIFFSGLAFIPSNAPEATIQLDCNGMTILRACDINDTCTLTKIEVEGHSQMECRLRCDDPNPQFLDQMCNSWNVEEACNSNLSSVYLTAYSNLSQTIYEQPCLTFPVNQLIYNNSQLVPQPSCDQPSSAKCVVDCDSPAVMSLLEDVVIESQDVDYWTTVAFQMLFGFTCASWGAQAVVVSLSDSICFNLLGDRPHDYGKQRMWGAVGWGLFSVIAGLLIDLASMGKTYKDYTPSYYLTVIILAINILAVCRIKVEYRREPNAFRKAARLIKDVKVLLFLSCCITFGLCIALVWQFQLWYLEDLARAQGCDSLTWIKLLQGLTMGIQCLAGEAPFIFLSGWFLKNLGHVYTMTLILIAMGVRLLCYSFLVNPWWTLPIEVLNGLTLGLYWGTMTSYADLVAPDGTASTLQGIFGAIFEGIGVSLGSLAGGFLYESHGGSFMFRSFGIYSMVYGTIFCLIHLVMNYFQRRKGSSESGKEKTEIESSEDTRGRISDSDETVKEDP